MIKLALINAVFIFIRILEFLFIARAFLSWLPMAVQSPGATDILYKIIRVIHGITEPILGPIRKLMNRSIFGKNTMGFDFSIIIAFILLEAVKTLLGILILG